MPNKLFFELDKQKQDRIISAAITEFATHGYENSSTNRIVKECAISKGSLFKYFENKEDLYFFLIDTKKLKSLNTGQHVFDLTIYKEFK